MTLRSYSMKYKFIWRKPTSGVDKSNMKIQNQILINSIKYNEMVENVLYDGYNQLKDEFTYLDVEIHN